MSVQIYLSIFMLVCLCAFLVSFVFARGFFRKEMSEKIKLDISLAQMIESEKKIQKILDENNIDSTVALTKIATLFDVEKGGSEKNLLEQAYLKEEKGKKVVVFQQGLSEVEKRFVFAHEIAHLINGDTVPVTRPSGRNKAQIEQLADYTAAALLMPYDRIYGYLEQNNYKNSSARKRTMMIRSLCREYGVTEVIALRRVKEVYVLNRAEK